MTASPPTVVLPAALVDPTWLGATRLAHASALAGWRALARVASVIEAQGPEARVPSDPGHLRWLQRHLGLPEGIALAGCAALSDGRPAAAWRLDPVHLHIGRDHLVLTDPRTLELTRTEADGLAEAVAPLFAEDGLRLEPATPERWYLTESDAARPLRLMTRPLAGAIGRSVEAWLPTGDDARRWRRLSNAVQMTWFEHPVNLLRQQTHRPTVNSLWIEGRCPSGVLSDGPRLRTAAQLAVQLGRSLDPGEPPGHDPGAGRAAPAPAQTSGAVALSVEPRLLDAQLAGDPLRWLDAWKSLDEALFAPAAAGAAPWGDGVQLVLAGDAGWRTLSVTARRRWRFWSRPAPSRLLEEPSGPDADPGPGR